MTKILMEPRKGYPESEACETWEKDGIVFSLVRQSIPMPPNMLSAGIMNLLSDYYCGYCRFPERPLKEGHYDGIATYVPVHGGITWAEEAEDGSMAYGFDCAHGGDEDDPDLRDPEWLKAECERMAAAIKLAADFEPDYLAAGDDEAKAKVLDRYHERLAEDGLVFKLEGNFGAMLNLLSGEL